MRTIIIGTGIAGVSAAAALRRADPDRTIVLIGDEPGVPYRRPPVSKEYFRAEKDLDQIRIKKSEWYEQQAIDLRTGLRVTAVDPERHLIYTEDAELEFDQLLLATGGAARYLPADGAPAGAPAFHTLRTVTDVPALREQLHRAGEVLIVGAGLIGSEIASSAREMGCAVTMLESESLPLTGLLPPVLGQAYADIHRAEGVDLHTDVLVNRIERDAEKTVVEAQDGRSWSSPVVIQAIGMQAATDLAGAAGIELAPRAEGGGILVDGYGRTSAPDVWAAGDAASFVHPLIGQRQRIEHWQHAQNHGTAVGKAMADAGAPFDDVPWCWSDQYGLTLQVAGWPDAGRDVFLRGNTHKREFSAFFCTDGVIVGAVNLERPRENRTAKKWISRQLRPDPAVLTDEDAELSAAVGA